MRAILAALMILAVAPTVAEDWQRYDNAQFGYTVELPSSFAVEEQNAARLVLKDGVVSLEIFGLDLAPLGFADATALAIKSSADEGFAIVGQTTTGNWARWSGVNGARQLAAGLVPLCGSALAGYELRFMDADGARLQPVIDRLATSLRNTRTC